MKWKKREDFGPLIGTEYVIAYEENGELRKEVAEFQSDGLGDSHWFINPDLWIDDSDVRYWAELSDPE